MRAEKLEAGISRARRTGSERLEVRLHAGLGEHDRCDRPIDLGEHRRHRPEVYRQARAFPPAAAMRARKSS